MKLSKYETAKSEVFAERGEYQAANECQPSRKSIFSTWLQSVYCKVKNPVMRTIGKLAVTLNFWHRNTQYANFPIALLYLSRLWGQAMCEDQYSAYMKALSNRARHLGKRDDIQDGKEQDFAGIEVHSAKAEFQKCMSGDKFQSFGLEAAPPFTIKVTRATVVPAKMVQDLGIMFQGNNKSWTYKNLVSEPCSESGRRKSANCGATLTVCGDDPVPRVQLQLPFVGKALGLLSHLPVGVSKWLQEYAPYNLVHPPVADALVIVLNKKSAQAIGYEGSLESKIVTGKTRSPTRQYAASVENEEFSHVSERARFLAQTRKSATHTLSRAEIMSGNKTDHDNTTMVPVILRILDPTSSTPHPNPLLKSKAFETPELGKTPIVFSDHTKFFEIEESLEKMAQESMQGSTRQGL